MAAVAGIAIKLKQQLDGTREKKGRMTVENDSGKGVGSSFNAWAARFYPATRIVSIGTGCLRALRLEMVGVISRIDDELNRRDRGGLNNGGVCALPAETYSRIE